MRLGPLHGGSASHGLLSTVFAVGAPAIGWLCDFSGARGALVIGGIVTTAAAAVGGMLLNRLRGRSVFAVVAGRLPVAEPAQLSGLPNSRQFVSVISIR